jgi:hypothetical protein
MRPLARVNFAKVDRPCPQAEIIERRSDVLRVGPIASQEEPLDRARGLDHLSQNPKQGDEIIPTNPAVAKRLDPTTVFVRIKRTDKSRWRVTHHGEKRLDRGEHARDPAEREPGGTEPSYLSVGRVTKTPDHVHRIGSRVEVVELEIQPIERVPRRLSHRGLTMSGRHELLLQDTRRM